MTRGHLEGIVSAHGAFLGDPLGSLGCSLGVTEGPQAMPGRLGVGPWGPHGGVHGGSLRDPGGPGKLLGGSMGSPEGPREGV